MRLPKAAWPIILSARKLLRPVRKQWRLRKLKQSFNKIAKAQNSRLVAFTCNICGNHCKAPEILISREVVSCVYCGSTVRYRAMMDALVFGLYRKHLSLPALLPDAAMRGVGISDAIDYAEPLAKIFNYTNTYYHKEPYLDVTLPSADYLGALDFIVISDVLEHVCPPVERAFSGLHAMLKPGGVCIITVPCTDDGDEVEHYPELKDFTIEQRNGDYVVLNTTASGEQQEFTQPVFHGGAGLTLEMRIFSRASLLAQLSTAGFTDIEVLEGDVEEFGIVWRGGRSVPVVARKAV